MDWTRATAEDRNSMKESKILCRNGVELASESAVDEARVVISCWSLVISCTVLEARLAIKVLLAERVEI